ncbi:hypothetical protein QR680_007184 [Steinernema hermaphroditum]|uniref:7TM GPCR serpentine receptor class x (Srx) domain-containing protein n=1 Tax=Steinernema hermaphroditum TaxID=289476 RepID=A0AA39I0D5_9BILA|nr:hypothetical protein QR680_007184 [Steinernema hermaphroditum]
MSTDLAAENDTDRFIGAVILMIGGFAGLCVNIFVIYGVKRVKTFGESFGKICISQCAANCGNAAVFALLVAPITIINPSFHSTYWGARCGQLLIMFWNADLFSHVVTTMNRFCSIFFPFKYSNIFDQKTTRTLIGIVWTIAVCQVLPYFHDDCTLQFDMPTLMFQFKPTQCALYVGLYFDLYLSLSFIGLITVVDLITLWKIRRISKCVEDMTEGRKRRKREIKFFFQALSQATIVITELTFYFYISNYITNKWLKFASTSFAWILLQMSDGLIVILYNKELRSIRPKTHSSAMSSTHKPHSQHEHRTPNAVTSF